MPNGIMFNLLWEALIAAVVFIIARFVRPVVTPETIEDVRSKFNLICDIAEKLVADARYMMSDKKGSEKMDYVVGKLVQVAESYGLDLDEDFMRATAQKAYDEMIASEKAETTPTITNVLPAPVVTTTPITTVTGPTGTNGYISEGVNVVTSGVTNTVVTTTSSAPEVQ